MARAVWFWQRMVSAHMAGLASALADRGVETYFVAETALTADRVALGWEVPDLGLAHLLYASDPAAVRALVRSAGPDSLHICQGLRANALVRLAQMALARRGLDQWVVMETVDDRGWRGAARRLVYRALIRLRRHHIAGYLATGSRTASWLVERGVPPASVFPFTYFLPALPALPSPPAVSDRPFRIVFVGQFIRRKRLDLLIEATAALGRSDVELVIVGAGPLKDRLKALATAKLGSRVTWLGRQAQGAVPTIIASSDCLVLPSRFDGWGAVASEALMAGTPVICSEGCGCAGVVRSSGAGGVFETNNLAELTDALSRAVDGGKQTPGARRQLAQWARCLTAEVGSAYLQEILGFDPHADPRPVPPWLVPAAPEVMGLQVPNQPGPGRVLIFQPALPSYRLDLFDRLSRALGGRFQVYYSPEDMGALTQARPQPVWAVAIGRILRPLRGVEWQKGALSVPLRRFDTVVVSGAPRCLSNLLLLAKARLVGARTIWWGQYWSGTTKPHWFAVRMFLTRFSDAVIFYTDREVSAYRQGPGAGDRRPVSALNNGIDVQPIAARRAPYRASGRDRAGLFIGRLTEKSRVDLLVEAMAQPALSDFRLHIIGDGPGRRNLEAKARSLKVDARIDWHPATIDETLIAAVANRCRVFVYPGGVGLSLIHAMAYGLPTVVHDTARVHMPEIAAFQDGETGMSFRHDDATDLAETLNACLSDDARLERMSQACIRVTSENYNTATMAARFIEAIGNTEGKAA